MGEKTTAFLKGGCGCLVAFFVIAILGGVIGASARIDFGGVVLLFLIGGIFGLIVLRVYKKGYTQGQEDANLPPPFWMKKEESDKN